MSVESKIDKQNKNKQNLEQAKNIIIYILKNDSLNIDKYLLKDTDQRFEYILRLYSKLNPDWMEQYNELEHKKDKKLQTILPSDYTIENLIKRGKSDELTEMVLTMHASNRIAHLCEFAIRKYMAIWLKNNQIQCNDFERLISNISIYLDKSNSNITTIQNKAKKTLNTLGITQDKLEELERSLSKTITTQNAAFYIKDTEIERIIEELQKRDESKDEEDHISYGMQSEPLTDYNGKIITQKDGTPKMQHLLVIDLPLYSQFSVHLKSAKSISALSQTPYDMKIPRYERGTIMLTDRRSKSADLFMARRQGEGKWNAKEMMEDLKKIYDRGDDDSRRYAHYLAVKAGATRKDIEELYRGDKDDK